MNPPPLRFESSDERLRARLDVGGAKPVTMADEHEVPDRASVLAHLLSKDGEQPRDEPRIAANIHEQLQHMGLSTWSVSVLRRLRDAIARQSPGSILEVGAGIGHRSAWLLDITERTKQPFDTFTLVEQGGKFGVILQRLLNRYDSLNWASVVVGEPTQLAAEHQAWALASQTGSELSKTPFNATYDAIIIDGPSPQRAGLVQTYLPLLHDNGVLYTVEPDMPTGEVSEDDSDGMALVSGFNEWIELVGQTQSTHHVAFMPLFGGTLVAWLPRQD